ncbi:glycoside hydrolase family 15 protein [Opitutus terrae]|uniref:Trehalase n=1 Tax=Opitutus terrae (strain DSM 11246 / JCM 15787 / PB90-1) TaxID=452637 RepID=B1ZU43_OPITP|nr:glycoside hydrolase family 15 protein [Opitutus terrae]ACB76609.1 glycoside hydrolase 15-related [Opitutus terrae PB90-1]
MNLECYGFIGDLHTCALVGVNGSVDWLCLPRADSQAVFAALLGDENNGCWRIAPREPAIRSGQSYQPDTLVLETEFETSSGVVRVIDCMPPGRSRRDLVRVVQGVRGSVPMALRLVIRMDYGRTIPWVRHADGGGMMAVAGPDAVVLRTNVPTHGEQLSTVAEFVVHEGDKVPFVLSWFPSHTPQPDPIDPLRALERTQLFWREWVSRCTYRGEWRDAVVRSLITLKGLTYAPTGGILAAATTSLPEQIGGVRNWDYRYCWLRDATFTLYSFMEAGYTEEAAAWGDWLLRAVAGDPAQLQIMFGAAGERTLTELELPHLAGFEGSRPVRIGNAASAQFQLDIYGEVLDAMHLARKVGLRLGPHSWSLQRHLVDFVVKNWREPDEGIWEIRGPRRHFTHSKVMAWVALDRAVKAIEQFDLPGDLEGWSRAREEIHTDVCEHGYNKQRQAFTQYYGADLLDASLLMMPLVGFLPARDPRVVGTVEAIQRELVQDGLVYRYHPLRSGNVDGLPPGEGAFLPCSFWLVDCLKLIGREREAHELFERLLGLRNGLGLLAEEYDPGHRRLVGNFPQAFSHIGLINSAQNLSRGAVGPAAGRSSESEH